MSDSHIVDPLGRRIILHDHTWFGHIVKGHPEMRNRRAAVEQAIQAPMTIRFSSIDVNCRVYYGSGGAPHFLVAAVADVVGGFVKTAYRARAPKGVVEW